MKRPLVQLLAAAGLGLIAALAHPPFGLIPGILAWGGLMLLVERAATLKGAFLRGWLFGAAYFGLSCWWVAEAFYVDAQTFGWMAPFAVGFLAGGLALFHGLAALLFRKTGPAGPAARVLMFAACVSVLEWLRGHVFTGFPWNLPGTSWEAGGYVSQSARLIGVYGLTYVTVAIAAAFAVLAEAPRRRSHQAAGVLALVALAGLYAYGAARLAEPEEAGRKIAVRIVQPNVPQAAKYDDALYADIVGRYLALTTSPVAPQKAYPGIVVWPEGALPASFNAYLSPGDPVRDAITAALAPGQTLIVGGWRRDGDDAFNSLVAVRRAPEGLEVTAVYDKHHLVPFGEYVPAAFRALGLSQLVPLSPFTPGPRPEPVDIGPIRIQPLICYEALFPGYVRSGARASGRPAQLIVNISNDAWFGKTSGPWQHSNQARYRAIEESLPMVRATPTGVSSVIDKYGRVRKDELLGQGVSGVIDAQVLVAAGEDQSKKNAARPVIAHLDPSTMGFLVMLLLSCLVWLWPRAKRAKKSVT